MKQPRQPLLGPVERQALLRSLHKHHPRVAVAAELMAQLGLRLNEARLAQWGWLRNLDSPAATIHIPESATKTKTARTLPLPTTTRLMLLELLKRQNLQRPMLIPAHWPLALNRWGQAPSKAYICRVLRYTSEGVLGRRVRSHTLRHSFASELLKHTNIRVVQLALGHRSITSTELYTHPQLEDVRAALEKVDAEYFRGDSNP